MVAHKLVISKFRELSAQDQYQGKWWSAEALTNVLQKRFHFTDKLNLTKATFNRALSGDVEFGPKIDEY